MNKGLFIIIPFFVLLMQTLYPQQNNPSNGKIVKIGLLVNSSNSIAAQNAAELAVQIANKSDDLNGWQFNVITRSMEGPWGTGSKEAVNLVFNENVWAILGSHDGRNAHLVEQVIAKTKVVHVSAWASDPTLSQAYVPWFYNCVPNDIQQAEVLINGIVKKEKFNKIALIVQESYDAKKALKYMKEQIQAVCNHNPYVSSFIFNLNSTEEAVKEFRNKAIEAIIILGNQEQSWELLGLLRKNGLKLPVFGTISMLGALELREIEHRNPLNLTVPNSGDWMKWNTLDSRKRIDRSSSISNAIGAYTFDGINVLINAIKSSGFDRDRFYGTISKTNYNGITDNIQFDKNGNRLSDMNLVKILDEDSPFLKK